MDIINKEHQSKITSIFQLKFFDLLFIYSSMIFNLSVAIIYIATKLENSVLQQVAGGLVILLIIPFTITFLGYLKVKEVKKIIISNGIILFYLFIELLLDYILKIPFREIISIHILYILIFYVAVFSMLGVAFDKNKKLGVVVLITFFILLGCLTYLYIGCVCF